MKRAQMLIGLKAALNLMEPGGSIYNALQEAIKRLEPKRSGKGERNNEDHDA